jgi:murein DD-endopeptidase MepM/ murein hydrolase activator NlpD
LPVRGLASARPFARPAVALVVAMLAFVLAGVGTALAGGSGSAGGPARTIAREQAPGDPTGYRLPFAPGAAIEIVQAWHSSYSHNGKAEYAYDFGLLDGRPVLAAASGIVSYAHDGEWACGGPKLLREVNYVTIDHPDGSATLYAHLSSVEVKVGDVVAAGQEIGLSGRTGYTQCRPHLHFARQAQGGAVTQSIPVYFDGFAERPLELAEMITAPAPACAAEGSEPDNASATASSQAPLGRFCAVYGPLAPGSPPLFERLEDAIDGNWNAQAPGGYWLDAPADGFSARWSGRFEFARAGTYRFRAVAGERFWVEVDGRRVAFNAPDTRGMLQANIHLAAGIHWIDVTTASPDGRGVLKLDWDVAGFDGVPSRWTRLIPLQ